MLPNQEQLAQFQAYMNQMIASSPDLFMYCDPWKLERIAKEDLKLAEKMFLLSQRKAVQAKAQQAAQNTQLTAQTQIESAQAKTKGEMDLENAKADNQMKIKQLQWQQEKELATINMFAAIYSKGLPLPPELQAVEKEMISNVMIPVFGQNIGNKIALAQGLQGMMQQGGPADQGGAPPGGQPQQDMGQPGPPPDQGQMGPQAQPAMQPS